MDRKTKIVWGKISIFIRFNVRIYTAKKFEGEREKTMKYYFLF